MAIKLIVTCSILGVIAYSHVWVFPVEPDSHKPESHGSYLSTPPDVLELPKLSPSPKAKPAAFMSLHPELRIQIWQDYLSARPPRTIRVKKNGHPLEEKFTRSAFGAAPSLLHLSSESRKEALKFYSVLLPRHLPYPIYIDYSQDILVFGCHPSEQKAVNGADTLMRIMGWLSRSEEEDLCFKLRRLEIRGYLEDLAKFHSLERLIMPSFLAHAEYYYALRGSVSIPILLMDYYKSLKNKKAGWLRMMWKKGENRINEGEAGNRENMEEWKTDPNETVISFGNKDLDWKMDSPLEKQLL